MTLTTPWLLVIIAPLLYLWWRLGRGAGYVRVLRVVALLVVVLMLTGPALLLQQPARSVVLLVDQSLSCGQKAIARAVEDAGYLRGNRGLAPDDALQIVAFGEGATMISADGRTDELATTALQDASELAEGLSRAAALLTGRNGGRICVISDGLYTGADPLDRLPTLLKNALVVDYAPILIDRTEDVAVTQVRMPERVQQGHPFEMAFAVSSHDTREAQIRIERHGRTINRTVQLQPGEQWFTLRDTAGPVGPARYTVQVEAGDDPCPENNLALAVMNSVGPTRILVLNAAEGQTGGHESNLTRALRAAGMNVAVGGVGTAITSADLKSCAAVVLENVSLSSLDSRADAALRNFVTETGGGLLITGGRSSFADGGYYLSRLDDILPVTMMRKDEYIRPKVAMCIVLDRSGSMTAPVGGGKTKIDLANRASAEAIGLLQPQDEIAVLAVDSASNTIVKLTKVGTRREAIRNDVLKIESMGGGIYVYTGLEAAVCQLNRSSAGTRHIVLFSDAADSEEPGDYKNLVDKWSKAGGTISVIGLGTDRDCDAAFLKDIAKRGGGSIFFTVDANALPRIFCEDAMRIARKNFLDEPTGAAVSNEIVRIGRLGIGKFPQVNGYNLCYTRPSALQLISTTDENTAPLLAVQQSGLGRVAALTCEVDGKYTGPLAAWKHYGPFIAALVKHVQRERDDLALFATIKRSGRTATVILEMEARTAQSSTGATAVIIPPDEGEAQKLPMRWTGPNRMEATCRLTSDGVFHGVVLTREGRRVSLPPVVLPYSPEYEPVAPDAGEKALAELARATGGAKVMHIRELLAVPPGTRQVRVSLVPWLAALLIALLLADIIARKHLWAHMVPAFVPRAWRRTATAVRNTRLRRRDTTTVEHKDFDTPTPPPSQGTAGPTAPPDAPPEAPPRESPFARAKRRSRAGQDKK